MSGLLVYLISLASLHLSTLFIRTYKYFSLFIFLLVGLLAAFRGSAGIDTHLYIRRFLFIESLSDISLSEPLLPLLMWLVKFFGGSFPVFSLVYSVILSTLYYYIFRSFPNAIYFGITVFPVIFIDSLYNGIRIGLAYPLIFIAIARSSLPFLIAAASAHVSSLVAAIFRIFPLFHYMILGVFTAFIFFTEISPVDLLPHRYIYKMHVYQELSPRTTYAGLSDCAALWVALIIYCRISKFEWKKTIFIGCVLFILFGVLYYFIINNYVAALRVVRLLVICVFGLIARQKYEVDKLLFAVYLFFGMAYSANFIRQVVASYSHAGGGFLPLPF